MYRQLTAAEVLRILELYKEGLSSANIAIRMGTTRANVSHIIRGRSHNSVTGIPRRKEKAHE